ncbi:hypothetical protein LCGC14_1450440 [marine sediment metagenome]|uniref:Uncharacterized protein n=1 Tax=marine sediment metagenome TaxID=412755 RepID=A0A0F9JIR6_9ZZZZ
MRSSDGDGIVAQADEDLQGRLIKEVFARAEEIADLHATITSSRGDRFRARLLHVLESKVDTAAIQEMAEERGLREYRRHLNKLAKFSLIRVEPSAEGEEIIRTPLGEQAVNALRELERRLGIEEARSLYDASLGTNSIRLFLRIYSCEKGVDWDTLKVRFTPAEIGRLSLFLPRSIEGISAVDKLNEAGLVSYEDDGFIYMRPRRTRAFYQYLRSLLEILQGYPDAG